MKFKNQFLTGILATALLATACNNEEKVVDNQDGMLKITIVGDGESSRATGTPTFESTVNKYTVYVFNANTETLEASVPGTIGAPTVVSGLSTGFSKKIVVVANQPSTFPILYAGELYSYLNSSATVIDLDYQSVTSATTNGLVMMGEMDNITLSATGTNEVTIPIKRIAAKLTLGSITLMPTEDYDPDLFEVTGVSVQRATSKVNIYGNPLSTDPSTLYGGELGSYNSALKSYLQDDISATFTVGLPTSLGNYFYVFPNGVAEDCTLLTVAAIYGDDEIFFPVRINYSAGSGNTDGMLIESNKSYVLNLTINHLADGTTDPDVPPTEADINVNITVADWDLVITQNEVW